MYGKATYYFPVHILASVNIYKLHRLRVFENTVLCRMFELKTKEVA